jgi:hypothetical protein
VHADAERQPQRAGLRIGLRQQALLHQQRTAQRRGGAGEREQHRVPGHVDDPALLGVAALTEHRAGGVQQFHGEPVVDGHQPRVARRIGCQDSDQAGGRKRGRRGRRGLAHGASRIVAGGGG